MHALGLMEILGEYEGKSLNSFEGPTDGTKDVNIEGLLIGFLDGSLDSTAEGELERNIEGCILGKDEGAVEGS